MEEKLKQKEKLS